jgi:hypothetical protein
LNISEKYIDTGTSIIPLDSFLKFIIKKKK